MKIWKVKMYLSMWKAQTKTAYRQFQWAFRVGKTVWDLRKSSDNGVFRTIIWMYMERKTPLAYHADFYLTNLLRGTTVETRMENNKVTISFLED